MAVECIGKTVKDKLDANIIVFSDAWGLGKKTKRVIFVFGDGSVKKAEIKGECFDETGLHNLHVSPSELYIELNDGTKNGVISRDVKVFTEEETVHINSEGIEWLNAKLLEKDKNEFRTIEIEIHKGKLKDQETVAYLDIWSKENVPKIKLPIHISTPKQFTIKPRIAKITLGKNEISSTTFMITPLFENDKKISIIDASTEKSELVLNWGDSIEENNKLSVSIKQKQIDFGLHPIDMMVSINNNIYTERVYVLVK